MMKLKALALGIAILSAPTAAFAQQTCSGQPASGFVCGNGTSSQALPGFYSQSALLDMGFGSIQGRIINRGVSVWSATATPSLGLNGTVGGSLTFNGATSGASTVGVAAAAGTSTFQLPVGNGTNGFVLSTDGSGHTSWISAPGSGTVTSVALALPGIFSVSGSPVTTAGTLTGSLTTQTANLVWAGPTTGAAAAPTFRALVGADLPNPSALTLGGVSSTTCISHQWFNTISTIGHPNCSQPDFSDISGSVTGAQLPNPSSSTLGGVRSLAAVTHQWINTISTSGIPSATQPGFTDLSGSASLAQLPSISSSSVLGNNSGGTAVPSALSASNVLDFVAATQGDVLYRNASAWVALPPGTSGQVLTTGGAAANPAWATVSGTGTVTSVATNNGLTGGPVTTTGTIGLATITSGSILANVTGGSAVPVASTPSAILDLFGSSTGNILYRSSGGWTALGPGTNGQVLTQGASTPSWSNAGTLTNVTIVGAGLTANSGTCNISTTGTCTLTTTAASKTDEQTGTSATLATTPSQQQQHDSAAKFWVIFTGSASNGSQTINASYNVTSVVRSATGVYAVNYTTAFSSANYAIIATGGASSVLAAQVTTSPIQTASSATLAFTTTGGTGIDPSLGYAVGYGRQ